MKSKAGSMGRKKVTVIGAGNVGSSVAHLLALKELADVVMLDIAEGIARGKALDILEASPIEGFNSMVKGTSNYEETANSDIAVICAGSPRKPGMSREELLKTNASIVAQVAEKLAKASPGAVLIVVTNPLDAMSYVAMKASGYPRNRVIGMAGVLDSARLRTFIALELGVSPGDVNAIVLGSHGDSMVPLISYTTVKGVPITRLLPEDKIRELVERTRNAGAEILGLLKASSAYYAPASAVVEMVEAVLLDQKKILPCSAYLEGEYGVSGCFLGVPVKLGSEGIEEILELELSEEEQRLLHASAEKSRELVEMLG
jgi:malate dehydrogenase